MSHLFLFLLWIIKAKTNSIGINTHALITQFFINFASSGINAAHTNPEFLNLITVAVITNASATQWLAS